MDHERAVQNLAVECYLLGEMSPGERDAFEEHYFECAVCAEDVRAAAQFIQDAKEVLTTAGAPAVPIRPRETVSRANDRWAWLAWLQPQFAAAVIAALVLFAGVENFSTIPGLRRQVDESGSPRIVKYAVLPPATRGDAAVVKARLGDAVALLFDAPESPDLSVGSPLRFVVKSADGRVMFELPGAAPNPGEQISLSLPRLQLQPGNYTLIVQAAGTSSKVGQELGQYPFKLE
ncbi:MAG TPA: zf-HC2 domain-containing protein [Bryobacteraceae bacterium]|jgi:hypothetical protein